MKTIRELEYLEATLTWYGDGDIARKQILDNELYYASKLKDQNMKKIKYYEKKILKDEMKYQTLLEESSKRIELRDFNANFISEMQRGLGYELYEIYDFRKYDTESIDYLINASMLYREVYTNYPNNNYRNEFATAMTNAYLKNKTKKEFVSYFSEVINSNNPLFSGAVIDDEKWPLIYLRLLHGQLRKNNERIKNMNKLRANNAKYFINYSAEIEKYISSETVFTITNFIEKNNISYNTGKKYLKDLVEKGILQPIKIGKHNAFVYQDMYDVWLK